jgi:hypothetical protein
MSQAQYLANAIQPVNIEKTSKNINNILLYPNPTNRILNINTNGAVVEMMMIYNILGQKITNIDIKPNTNIHTTDCNNLIPGIYTVQVKDKNGFISNLKFIKH